MKVFENYIFHIASTNGVNSTSNIKSINKFKVTILKFVRPKGKLDFHIYVNNGIKLMELSNIKFQSLK